MKALDDFIPEPVREVDKPFLMPIEDVFSIKGRGTVGTGRIERGIVKVGDTCEIVGLGDTRSTVVTGVEMFQKTLDQGQAGDNVGCLLRGVEKTDLERGQVLAKPGSITPHKKFNGEVYVLTKEEGGRHSPFFTGYRPQFYFRTTDVTGTIKLLGGAEMCMPGDNINMEIELLNTSIAMEEGLRFAIREGGQDGGCGRRDEDSGVRKPRRAGEWSARLTARHASANGNNAEAWHPKSYGVEKWPNRRPENTFGFSAATAAT